jgi:hypothetical protein
MTTGYLCQNSIENKIVFTLISMSLKRFSRKRMINNNVNEMLELKKNYVNSYVCY